MLAGTPRQPSQAGSGSRAARRMCGRFPLDTVSESTEVAGEGCHREGRESHCRDIMALCRDFPLTEVGQNC